MPRKFSIQVLRKKSKDRKPGYIEAVLSIAQRTGDILELSDKQFAYIRKEYTPPTDWPSEVLPLKQQAQHGDRGLGDIVERVIGPVNGAAYRAWYLETLGKTCKGTWGKDELNHRFPL